MIKRNKMRGFTLVELLAVIVILAIILVIAVPKIMNTIKDTTKASFESSAKMVAAQVENQYTVAKTLGKEFGDTGNCKQDWAGLNDTDYAECTYDISEGTAKVTLKGSGKFNGLSVCEGTRNSATATEEGCEDTNVTTAASFITGLLADESTLQNGLVQTYATVNGEQVDAGIRYAGATSDVKNQVYFNCAETDGINDYGTENYDYANNCEKWRIIGVFNTKSSESDTTGTPRIKIVRGDVLSTNMEWDTPADGVDYINQWGETTLTSDNTTVYPGASLMQYLNGNTDGNYYYSLTSIAKGQIEENALWYTGAVEDGTASKVYEDERSNATGTGTTVNYTTTWVGKIGLIYPSDFGYAGTNCGDKTIFYYDESCGETSNWLTPSYGYYWTISSVVSSSENFWLVGSGGYADYTDVEDTIRVRPALYLDSNVQIIGGEGVIGNAYRLSA